MARVYVQRSDLPARLIDLLDEKPAAAECTPPMDVVETVERLEVLIDVPGVSAADIEVVLADNVLLITGEKVPAACEHGDVGFHIAERAFGRFARAIRIDGAFDAAGATATLADGELRVVLTRIADRRGTQIRIPIQ